MQRVEVIWVDIVEDVGWVDGDPAQCEPVVCRQVGYLVHKDRHKVVLVNTVCAAGGTGGRTVLPRGCVRSITRI